MTFTIYIRREGGHHDAIATYSNELNAKLVIVLIEHYSRRLYPYVERTA